MAIRRGKPGTTVHMEIGPPSKPGGERWQQNKDVVLAKDEVQILRALPEPATVPPWHRRIAPRCVLCGALATRWYWGSHLMGWEIVGEGHRAAVYRRHEVTPVCAIHAPEVSDRLCDLYFSTTGTDAYLTWRRWAQYKYWRVELAVLRALRRHP